MKIGAESQVRIGTLFLEYSISRTRTQVRHYLAWADPRA